MLTPIDRCHTGIDTLLGRMTLSATAQGLAGAWFVGQRHYPQPAALGRRDERHPILHEAARQLRDYLGGTRRHFDLPLDLTTGTPFQQAVWLALQGIAIGTTCSYKDIGAAIGNPAAVRAVGAAVGRNPVSIIVPCHRVVGSGGSLTGYAGGLPRKAQLLALEAMAAATAAFPSAREPRRRTPTAKGRTMPA